MVGSVYFANYVRWQGKVREQFLADKAPEVLAELRNGLEHCAATANCRYHHALFPFGKVSLEISLDQLKENAALMNVDYFREAEDRRQLVASGSQEGAACGVRSRTSDTKEANENSNISEAAFISSR